MRPKIQILQGLKHVGFTTVVQAPLVTLRSLLIPQATTPDPASVLFFSFSTSTGLAGVGRLELKFLNFWPKLKLTQIPTFLTSSFKFCSNWATFSKKCSIFSPLTLTSSSNCSRTCLQRFTISRTTENYNEVSINAGGKRELKVWTVNAKKGSIWKSHRDRKKF